MTASSEKIGVRQLAAEILTKVDTRKAYADILLDSAIASTPLDERDRALLTEIVYGTLRWRGNLDARLDPHLHRSLADTDPLIRNLLRLSLYQLLFLDKVPDYAAVNDAVEAAKNLKTSKAAGFVNGVLRNVLRQKNAVTAPGMSTGASSALAATYSHPQWLVDKWLDYFGNDEAIALMRSCNEQAPLVIRVNNTRCLRDDLVRTFAGSGIAAMPTPHSAAGISLESAPPVERIPGFAEGFFQVQGESSQLVSVLLGPQANERILDACAAPGGKATHIAELMQDRGTVIALDKSAGGLRKIGENAARLRLRSIQTLFGDAGIGLPDPFAESYDRILVDAPCSGFGTLRSHPEIKWQRDQKDVKRISQLQQKILNNVCDYLKSGGVLVYSTCTLMREENEDVVQEFLASHAGFALEDAAAYLPETAKTLVKDKFFLSLPHRDNTDGFFAARLRKVN